MKLYFYKRTTPPQDDYLLYNQSLGLAGYKNPKPIGRFIIYGTEEEALEVVKKTIPRRQKGWY